MAESKKGLGKGLDALLPEDLDLEALEARGEIHLIATDALKPNKQQPRKSFDQQKLKELSDSIREKGVIQPIIVRQRSEGDYEIIVGERRVKAAQMAGVQKIPAIIKDIDNQEALQLALIENVQREDLSPLEEAEAYRVLHTEYKMTQNDIATKVGKSRATITNTLRMLRLPPMILKFIADGSLNVSQAKKLLEVKDEIRQIDLANRIVKKNMSIADLDKLIKRKPVRKQPSPELRSYIKTIEDELSGLMRTKVRLRELPKGGEIKIRFHSVDEFDRLMEAFRKGFGNT